MPNNILDNVYDSRPTRGNSNNNLREFNSDNFNKWLKDIGLHFNPFDLIYLDAGKDPQLPAYLVGHESFTALWQDQNSFVFAPVGGGKTAFRVRLARACRVGQDGRHVFPVVYKMPSPTRLRTNTPDLENHLTHINYTIAQEILLTLAYRPVRFSEFDKETRLKICELLTANLPFNLDHNLQELSEKGTLMPLVELFDRTAEHLFTLPHPNEIRNFCDELREVTLSSSLSTQVVKNGSAYERFEELIEFLEEVLGYEAIYILVDGVDGYPETTANPQFGIDLLKPLLFQIAPWTQRNIYTKYFLPMEFAPLVSAQELLFPGEQSLINLVEINWTYSMLDELLQERLRVASKGMFSSFEAITSPELHGVIHQELIATARSKLPREVLTLAAYLLQAPFRRLQPPSLIDPIDWEMAKQRYQEERVK